MTSSVVPSLLLNIPGSSILMSGPSRELVIGAHSVHLRGETRNSGRRQVTLNILPNDVLLEIFEIHTVNAGISRWRPLVHVCRRWRNVVFASTRRLNVQLWCTYTTPVRKMLDVWPTLPIIIKDSGGRVPRVEGADNIAAALEHRNRVRHIDLWNTPVSVLKRLAAGMKDPFPALTYLRLRTDTKIALAFPDSFSGGSAPRLQTLRLQGITCLAIPNLLSSAGDLVDLFLSNIPHSGYISPEAMVTGLSTLTRLEQLRISFMSPRSRPDQLTLPQSIRAVLPSLNYFSFKGVSEYLEDFTSRFDAPLLNDLRITFFNQLVFNTPRLCSFISHVEKLLSPNQAQMTFSRDSVKLSLFTARHLKFTLTIQCRGSDWQLSSLVQVCDSPFLSLFNLKHLDICELPGSQPHWQEDVEDIQWLELLRQFTTVQNLFLSREFVPRVAPAVQGERIVDILPALQSISLPAPLRQGHIKPAIASLLTGWRLSGRTVAANWLEWE